MTNALTGAPSDAERRGSPLVTVIVPVFNTSAFLHQCVDSVLMQTYQSLEVIVIDDGSTDDSPGICDFYADSDPRVRVIHQVNAGLSEARNAGLVHATGELIMYLDSDDWLDARCVEVLHGLLVTCDAQVAMCGTWRAVPSERDPSPVGGPSQTTCFTGDEFLRGGQTSGPVHPVSAWAKLIDRRLLDDFRFPGGRFHEDVFVTHEFLHRASRVACTGEVLHYYRVREGSITSGAMSLKSAADKARAHLQKAASLQVYGLESAAGLEFRRALGWHLRVRAANGRRGHRLATELSEQRALIKLTGSVITVGAATRMALLANAVFPDMVARIYSWAIRLSRKGHGPAHLIERE